MLQQTQEKQSSDNYSPIMLLKENTDVLSVEQSKSNLENMFLPFGFISNNKSKDNCEPFYFYVKGERFIKFLEPWYIVHFATRNTIRVLEGDEYTERFYNPVLQKEKQTKEDYEASKVLFEELLKDADRPPYQMGYTHLVYIKGEYTGFISIEAFNTMQSYWYLILKECQLEQKKVVKVNEICHKNNLKKSKITKNFYLSHFKFKNWEIEDINEEFKKEMFEAYKIQEKGITNFFIK